MRENNSNKQKSLERSNHLHSLGQEFINVKDQIPFGMKKDLIEQYNHKKNKILSILNGTPEDWDNWQWQLKNRITEVSVLENIFSFSPEDLKDIAEVSEKFRWAATPYYIALMDEKNPGDAIRKMIVPSTLELQGEGVPDPTGEEFSNPAGAIVRRYPDRLILNITNSCSSFCRFCQRKRNIVDKDVSVTTAEIDQSIEYIRENTEIRDVLITGGDPLALTTAFLEPVLAKVRSIPHVEIIRIGTRIPVVMPQRITEELVTMLKKYQPLYINTHFNHPQEITPESTRACTMLRDSGFVLGNQMVLLKGVNDDKFGVRLLNQELLKIGVKPYYMFHSKNVMGTLHFQTTIDKGIEIMEYLQGNVSGMAIPKFILSAPNGLGKVPLSPEYVVKNDEQSITVRTWENNFVKVMK